MFVHNFLHVYFIYRGKNNSSSLIIVCTLDHVYNQQVLIFIFLIRYLNRVKLSSKNVWTEKAQISLPIRAVWAGFRYPLTESSLR